MTAIYPCFEPSGSTGSCQQGGSRYRKVNELQIVKTLYISYWCQYLQHFIVIGYEKFTCSIDTGRLNGDT
jgi:hypothetical protein